MCYSLWAANHSTVTHTSWASTKTDFHLIGGYAVIWKYLQYKFDNRVPELTAHLPTPQVLESVLVSSRKAISNNLVTHVGIFVLKPTQNRQNTFRGCR